MAVRAQAVLHRVADEAACAPYRIMPEDGEFRVWKRHDGGWFRNALFVSRFDAEDYIVGKLRRFEP